MLPLLYHTHHSLHPEDLPFWLDLAAQSDDPILELGCGSGRVLLPLAQQGHTVFGLDNDFAMLSFLRQNLPATIAHRVHIFQADFAHLHIGKNFGLIIMPCNTYSTLPDLVRQAGLAAIRQLLLPGGRFALSIPNPVMFGRLPARSAAEIEEIFTHPTSGEPVQVSSAWQRNGQFFTVSWHYDHLTPDGQVQRLSAETRHHLIQLPAYLDELTATGFRTITIHGDYDRSPYAEESPQAIIVAQL